MVVVADSGNSATTGRRVQRFDLDGANPQAIGSPAEGVFPNATPLHVAVDSRGIIYANAGNALTARYATGGPTPGFLSSIAADTAGGPLLGTSTTGLEVDPDTDAGGPDVDRLLVARTGAGVPELDVSGETAVTVDLHMPGAGITANGLGIDTSGAGKLYVSANHRVFTLTDAGAGAPGLAIQPASDIGTEEATFHGL